MIIRAKELIDRVKEELKDSYPEDQVQSTAQYYLKERFGFTLTDLVLNSDCKIDIELLNADLRRLKEFEPIQHLFGEIDFGDLRLKVSGAALIPRPETEELVHLVLRQIEKLKSPHILDLCTGSGCIALLLKHLRADAKIDALEFSKEALSLAKENGEEHDLDVGWIHRDITDFNINPETHYQVIVSNPPYVTWKEAELMSRQVLDFEPSIALFAPKKDALFFFRQIIRVANSQRKKDVLICCEINEALGAEVLDLFSSEGFSEARIYQDLQGKDRFLLASR